ncbi:MAG: PGF-pre-PGF domain-containing protein [DPANN group archaeon]|nr:PGF-pre-PGF domain-containing protein [DPANN group archaeon]
MVNFTKTSVIATAVFVLFALAIVPAAAVWNLNFTVAYPNGTNINFANATIYLEAPPNAASLNGSFGTFQDGINQTNSSLANITIATDSATALYSLIVVGDGTNRQGGFANYVNPFLPAMTKAQWLNFLEGKTLRLVPALNIYLIAFNDTATNSTTVYVWPNGSIGALNGTHAGTGQNFKANANGSSGIWDIFSTNNGTGFTNNVRFNFTGNQTQLGEGGATTGKNGTSGTAFAYVIFDKTKGIPINYLKTTNNATNVTTVFSSPQSTHNKTAGVVGGASIGMVAGQIAGEVLPLDRNYTVVFYSMTGESPPRAVDIINPASNSSINLTARSLASPTYVVGITMNFTTNYVNVSGYIFVPTNATGNSLASGSPGYNVTNLTAIPYISNEFALVRAYQRQIDSNAVPLARLATAPGVTKVIGGINYSAIAYNISLPQSSSWILLASGGNKTGGNATRTGGDRMLGITNVTVGTANVFGINFTLRGLATPTNALTSQWSFLSNGSDGGVPINASSTLLQVVSGTSNATITGSSFLDIELNTNNTQTGVQPRLIKVRFMLETDAAGFAAFPFFANESAKIRVYTPGYAPREFLIAADNVAANASINLTMTEFRPSRPGPASSEHRGTIAGAGIEDVRFQIMSANATCDVITTLATDGCVLASGSTIRDINPFTALLYGDHASIRLRTSNGINIHYKSVDLLNSGIPDAQADILPQELSSTANANRVFRLGSASPKNYQEVFVGIPYSTTSGQDNSIDDRESVNLSIPVLYDQNWNVVWNVSVNGTPLQNSAAFNTTGFSDWNISMISNGTDGAGGVICANDTGAGGTACLLNTTEKMVWIRLPHFTGGGLGLRGANVAGGGTTSTAGSGSSGGGGGAGLSTGEGQTSQSAILSSITANTEAKTEFTAPAVAISEITFTPDANLNNVKLTVEKIGEVPAGTSSPSGEVYKLLEIKASGLTNSQLASDAKVTFNVDKSWLTENNVVKGSVKLLRFTGTWDALPTAFVSETDTQVTYQATTPGFSTFAISGEKSATAAAATSGGTAAGATGTTTPSTSGGGQQAVGPTTPTSKTTMLALLLVVIVVVVAIAAAMKKKRRY